MIGIDIGEKNIKIVELKEGPNGPLLTRFAISEVAARSKGESLEAAQSKTITQIFKELNFSSKEVYTSLSGPLVQVRHIKVPAMPDSELHEAVKWEAKNFVPFPIEEAVIDYVVLDEGSRQGGKLNVILTAIEGQAFKKHLQIIEKAGLKHAGLTIAPIALLELIKLTPQTQKNEVVALLDIGEKVASLNLYKNRTLQFTREIGTGLDRLAVETSDSLEYYREHFSEENISALFLSGEISQPKKIKELLSDNLGLPATIIDSQQIKIDPALDPDKLKVAAPRLTLAMGLALRKGKEMNLLKIRGARKAGKFDYESILEHIYIPNTMIVAALVLLIGFFVGINLYLNSDMNELKNSLDVKNLKLTRILKLQNRKNAFEDITKRQINVKLLLARINALMPRGISLAYLDFANDKREVQLGGESDNPQVASAFVKKIEDSPFFSKTDLIEIKKVEKTITFKLGFYIN